MSPVIAVVSAGAMGSAVAARLVAHRCVVLTNLDGRSPKSIERANKAGMKIVPLAEIASRADWLLSILPPNQAENFATQFFSIYKANGAQNSKSFVFADCNATNPTTVKRIASLAKQHGVPFVDGSIIGGPPRDTYNPTFYVSSDDVAITREFATLEKAGLKITVLEGEGAGIGDASALKMAYAGISKGITGLTMAMILSANASSPATAQALLSELLSSQSNLVKRIAWSIPDALPKAYRFEGEMEEISDFVRDQLGDGESKIHAGLASVYSRVAASVAQDGQGEDVLVMQKFVDAAKKSMEEQ